MLIKQTQPIINELMNNLKSRVGFMQVFKEMTKEDAIEVNNTLVISVGDYLKDISAYSPEVGEKVSDITFNELMKFPKFKAMFGNLKTPLLDNVLMEFKDITNNVLKEPGPMD